MVEIADSFLSKLHYLIVGTIMLGSLLMLPYFLSVVWTTPKAHAATLSPANTKVTVNDNPNIITEGMYSAIATAARATNSVADSAATEGKSVANGIGDGAGFLARGTVGSVSFVAHTTGSVIGVVTKVPNISHIIKPQDKTPIPVIDADHTVEPSTSATSINQKAAPPKIDSSAQWPIHGIITLEFGVPHWPFQAVHTGIDISDGTRSGVTAVRPFKPGRVIQVVQSNEGFGNHVIIDHGNGLTSLYGHLASISVHAGQEVNNTTILGREGTTGASTGVHLHFELRINGQPVNPHKYVNNRP